MGGARPPIKKEYCSRGCIIQDICNMTNQYKKHSQTELMDKCQHICSQTWRMLKHQPYTTTQKWLEKQRDTIMTDFRCQEKVDKYKQTLEDEKKK